MIKHKRLKLRCTKHFETEENKFSEKCVLTTLASCRGVRLHVPLDRRRRYITCGSQMRRATSSRVTQWYPGPQPCPRLTLHHAEVRRVQRFLPWPLSERGAGRRSSRSLRNVVRPFTGRKKSSTESEMTFIVQDTPNLPRGYPPIEGSHAESPSCASHADHPPIAGGVPRGGHSGPRHARDHGGVRQVADITHEVPTSGQDVTAGTRQHG